MVPSPHQSFPPCYFVSVHIMHPYSIIDRATAWNKFHFILSERSDFIMVDYLLNVVSTLPRYFVDITFS